MDPQDAELFYDSVVTEYRQALADAQFALAKVNAQMKVKDRLIAELTKQAEPDAD